MKLRTWAFVALATLAAAAPQASAAPTVYPTGVTIYDPARTWNGYTVLSPLATQAVLVIDMNGNVVKRWDDFNNSAGGPARVLPGGVVIAASGARPPHQESLELVQRDFDGKLVWQLRSQRADRDCRGAAPSGRRGSITIGSARTFRPATTRRRARRPSTGSNTLILTHTHHEATGGRRCACSRTTGSSRCRRTGDIVWEWVASDHIDELGFAPDARAAIKAAADVNAARGWFDWLHVNSATYVGPNRWFDAGRPALRAEQRHHQQPRSQPARHRRARRQRSSGGSAPTSVRSKELRAIRQIIGQHHAHFIPKGLPGAGNLLVFDNGGSSGYGFAEPDRAGRRRRLRARHVARARDQSRDARARLVLH